VATNQMSKLIQQIRSVALLPDAAGVTDSQLLECFITQREQAAFTALVHRHGKLVWGVCRRVLGSHHDAEDAFQATFLVLLRKAASIASRDLLPNWLYGVAHRTALKARSIAARTKARERQMTEMPDVEAPQQDLWHDLEPFLDQELSRLPDKYRAVLLLCDLEGKTRKEAARQLRVPEGTVAGQLARARTMLAKRLGRHSLALSGEVLGTMLVQNTASASASVPTSLMLSTVKITSIVAGGGAIAGVVSGQVAALTKGALQAMLLAKLKTVTACVLAVGALGVGGVVARQTVVAISDVGQPVSAPQVKAEQPLKALTPPQPDKSTPAQAEEKRYEFMFRSAPWMAVLEWYKDISGLPYVATTKQPTGSATFIPPQNKRQYTLNEITDILNEMLFEQQCLIIRRAASFTVVRADEPLDPALVATVGLDNLDKRAKTELVRVIMPLTNLNAREFAPAAKKMMGPFGQVIPLKEPNQLILIDHVANLLEIRKTIKVAEDRLVEKKQKDKDK